MPSIFDLMPAGLWPVQPFVPPDEQARTLVALQSQLASRDPPWLTPRLDPTSPNLTQASTWPSSSAQGLTFPAAPAAPPLSWPTTPVDGPPYDDASLSEWERAMRRALTAQGSATSAADVGGSASPVLADAKRAYDFARRVFGLPSAGQAAPTSNSSPSGTPQYLGSMPSNIVSTSADAVPPPIQANGADDTDDPPPRPFADQQPNLGAVYGNANITRQGERGRDVAEMRPPPSPAFADILPEIDRAAADAFHHINAGLNPFSAEARAAIEALKTASTPMDALASDWASKKRVGLGFLGIPELFAAPATGTARSLGGHGLHWLETNVLRKAAVAILGEDKVRQAELERGSPGGPSYEEAKNGVDQIMMGLAPRGGMLRAPPISGLRAPPNWRAVRSAATPAEPVQTPPGAPSTEAAGVPHVDPATAPLVPYDASSAKAEAQRRGIDLNQLLDRVREIHSALDSRAQRHRTTAILLTDGPTIVSGGATYNLEKQQLWRLQDGEIHSEFPGLHPEVNNLTTAMARFHRPRALAASRPFCPRCRPFIESMGGILTSDRTAVFPPF